MGQNFYQELSEYYDEVFPLEGSVLDFLVNTIPGGSRVLDLACGTGTYSIALAQSAYSVTGVELDEKMIGGAKKKDSSHTVKFIRGDITELGEFQGGNYDGVICIGNSVPHLADKPVVIRAFNTWYNLLSASGVMILQVVNFQKFARNEPTDLPTIKTQNIQFERQYIPADSSHVSFETKLSISGTKESLQNSVQLLILKRAFFEDSLTNLGFSRITYYGSYSKEPYDPSASFLLIAVAEKGHY